MAKFWIDEDGWLKSEGLIPGSLDDAVAKWEFIVENKAIDDGGQTYCSLCKAYWANDCDGCPVEEVAKEHCCSNTPYERWNKTHDPFYAQQELEFLRALRDEDIPLAESYLDHPVAK